MASLNQIVTSLANRVNQGSNYELKERLKLSFKNRLANRLRQDAEKNGEATTYRITFDIDVEKVDSFEDCELSSGCYILRSTNKVPRPLRVKRDDPFAFVGSLDNTPFQYEEFYNVQYTKYARYTDKFVKYTYKNEYILLFNNLRYEKIRVSDIFENRELVQICTSSSASNCYTDDHEFPAPADMIESINDEIMKNELITIQRNNEVKIDDNDRNNV